jgi:DNA ligase-1
VLYSDLVAFFTRLEATAKRLEMTAILGELFRATPPELVERVTNLVQGQVHPEHYGKPVGVADKLLVQALAHATGTLAGTVQARIKKSGDIGKATEVLVAEKRQKTLFVEQLTVERVYETFDKIAGASGSGSQDAKLSLVSQILGSAAPAEAKFVVRTLVGKLRLGVADMTIVDGLAAAFASPEDRDAIERAFNLTSDLGWVAALLSKDGIGKVRAVRIRLGHPVRVMLAERAASVEEAVGRLGSPALYETKYDGIRVQAHLHDSQVKLFSRRADDITEAFPDIAEALKRGFKGRAAVVEGEGVPVEPGTGRILPFQAISQRRGRKYGLDEARKRIPVKLFLFDCLRAGDEDVIDLPLSQRRERLSTLFEWSESLGVAEGRSASTKEEVQAVFDRALAEAGEGIMGKNLSAPYKAGARGYLWMKLKKDYLQGMVDTLDLVVVGAFMGTGKRGGGYGSLLVAAWNADTEKFETVSKVSTGFGDEDLKALPSILDAHIRDSPSPRLQTRMEADVWFEPAKVMEVLGAELTVSPVHTCAATLMREGGLALRFPRFTGRWREDKAAEDATTSEEVFKMFEKQARRDGSQGAESAEDAGEEDDAL